MTLIDLIKGAVVDKPIAPLSIALGNFDGIHKGHISLIESAIEIANKNNLLPAVWTFENNPFNTPQLITLNDKLALLKTFGIKYVALCTFEEICHYTPEQFFKSILIDSLSSQYVSCGVNFKFGENAIGNIETIQELSSKYDIGCHFAQLINYNSLPISSSRIRDMLLKGEIGDVNNMLGRAYSFSDTVIHGNEIGRTINFPTINQILSENHAKLKEGVYISRTLGHSSITNIGTRPTVHTEGPIICETHIIDYSRDLYGQNVKIELLHYIRPEQKFNSLSELKSQLEKDLKTAKSWNF